MVDGGGRWLPVIGCGSRCLVVGGCWRWLVGRWMEVVGDGWWWLLVVGGGWCGWWWLVVVGG